MRTPKVTVAWCLDCLGWTDERDIGDSCPADDCPRIMVKRVGYVCSRIDIPFPGYLCSMFHRTVRSMKECQHDAY